MYEKSYGPKYRRENDAGAYRSAADIAKDMRADIKALKAEGKLPADLAVSVTVDNFSMGRAINIKVPFREDFWLRCTGTVPGTETFDDDGSFVGGRACGDRWSHAENGKGHEVLSIEGQRVKKLVEEVHWAYNYDGSDSMTDYFDVNYYGSVDLVSRDGQAWIEREKARKAEQRKNAKAKAELIDHLVDDHQVWMKRGRLRQASYEGIVKLHDERKHGPDTHTHDVS